MHVPEGFLNAPTSTATAVVATAAVVWAVRRVRQTEPDSHRVPMAAMVAAFVFAAQMVNFAVGSGMSGHLMGGALAAVLVGPVAAVICIAGVLIVQAVLFADGGLTALGTNITLLAVVGVAVAWLTLRLLIRALPQHRLAIPVAASAGAFLSVPVAAAVFAGLFAVGGTAPIEVGSVFSAMVGWHLLIGLGEAAVTGLVVAVVMAARPDLVFAARLTGLAPRESVAS